MADASGDPNPADLYYSGRPLGFDPQQAQVVPAPPLQATTGEQANGLPAPQPPPRQDAGEQVTNHTHVPGVPGYYNGGRVSNTNTSAAPPSAPAPAPVASPLPAPAVQPERNLSWIEKWLMCFTAGRNAR